MKSLKLTLFSTLALAMLTIISCGKDDEVEPQADASSEVSINTKVDGADGFLSFAKSFTEIDLPAGVPDFGQDLTFEFYTAVAGFYDANGESFVNAGTITAEGTELTKQKNNVYLASLTDSIKYTSPTVSWSVGGSSDVSAFDAQTSRGLPSISGFSTDNVANISTSSDYTVNFGFSSNADSILVAVVGGSTSLVKTVSSSARSVTFSASELSGMRKGTMNGFVQVTPYNFALKSTAAGDIYMTQQITYSTFVDVE